MAKIFISYRREDSGYPAQGIYDKLVNHFGKESVVFDVDTIPFGSDFRDYLNREVSKCDILLAIIGDRWLEKLKERLNEPNDYVRIEIQVALERKIPVVPVLVEKATVPRENDLPKDLVDLVYRQAIGVRAGSDYQAHLNRLINGLNYLLNNLQSDEEPKVEPKKPTSASKRKTKPPTPKQTQKREAKPSKTKQGEIQKIFTNDIGMEFVLIPEGDFKMGSSLRPVRISSPFYLQKTQVTQQQWKEVMDNNPSEFKDCDDCPVETVSWDDAQDFIKKLNNIEGGDAYRLPTEAEWEYAARAGTTSEFSFGDNKDKLTNYGWFDSNSGDRTHPVGQKEPNAWGLNDMHGNVWEWVEDDWHEDFYGAPNDGRAWIDEPRWVYRVVRGGGWGDGAQYCGLAIRDNWEPDNRLEDLGFRLCRSVTLGL